MIHPMNPPAAATLFLTLTVALAACGRDDAREPHGNAADSHGHGHGHGHTHEAPHGGALVALGDHFAHVELVLDPEAARVTLYVLDAHAENARRVAHESLTLRVSQIDDREQPFDLTLQPVESALTGETVGDTSQFQADDERLADAQRLRAQLATLTVRGHTFENIPIHYPEGNE